MTEAGFGADLGAEKFFDIKCRKAGLTPAATVIVATVRALKMHGGVGKDDLKKENVEALKKGLANLGRHIENVKKFGVPIVVAINHFITDTDAEIEAVSSYLPASMASRPSTAPIGPRAARAPRRWPSMWPSSPTRARRSSRRSIPTTCRCGTRSGPSRGKSTAPTTSSPTRRVRDQFKAFEAQGYGKFPICMAKTQYSFSTDPNLKGAPVQPCRADPRGEARRRAPNSSWSSAVTS